MEDGAGKHSADGVNAFMQQVRSSLLLHVAQKSEEYELNFLTGVPYQRPLRFLWDVPNSSPSTVDSGTFSDTQSSEPEEEGDAWRLEECEYVDMCNRR